MGQRLNIEIKRKSDNKVLANAYYHWSAYTGSSLKLAKVILDNIWSTFMTTNGKSDTFRAIQLLQSTGAGVIDNEYENLDKEEQKYCKIGLDRNLGLISFTESGMEETRSWEEGRLTIVVDFEDKNSLDRENRVDFGVFYPTSLEEIKEYYGRELQNGDIDLENDIVDLTIDLNNMTYEDINYFISKLGMIESNNGIFKNKGQLYEIIY